MQHEIPEDNFTKAIRALMGSEPFHQMIDAMVEQVLFQTVASDDINQALRYEGQRDIVLKIYNTVERLKDE